MLTQLRPDGLWLGIAGNQRVRAGRILRELFTNDVDLIGTSDGWGASKPDIAFFDRVAEVVPFDVEEILYVGDRVDNDLCPGAAAGMRTALTRRGPWATIQWNDQEAKELPIFRLESLLELSGLIARFTGYTAGRRPSAPLPVVQLAHARLMLVRRELSAHIPDPVHAGQRPAASNALPGAPIMARGGNCRSCKQESAVRNRPRPPGERKGPRRDPGALSHALGAGAAGAAGAVGAAGGCRGPGVPGGD